jgi:hypothetical protein
MEDSTGCMHGSRGMAEPAADTLLSEPAIVAGIAKATLAPEPARAVGRLGGRLRAGARPHRAGTCPRSFTTSTSGSPRRAASAAERAAKERVWKTPTGKANFKGFGNLHADPDMPSPAPTCCA